MFSSTRAAESTLALPALTQLKTRTGIIQLHQFNGEDLADFISSMLDASHITAPIRDLLGDVRGQVQMDITSSISEITADATIMGKWAIITELGTGDILAIAADVSPPHQHGPAADTTWVVPRQDDSDATPHPQIHVFDAFGFAAFVEQATIVIGDNITTLKWASVDAVTPKNKHIRTIYHWLQSSLLLCIAHLARPSSSILLRTAVLRK
eukprot:SAG31_NODE_7160_length_1770_cov_18.769001_1_plen_210_part_00